jgi:NEDD8-activating enzyme E1 regulatory subunit
MKQFYDQHGCLPVPGNVPDMKAKSNVYVELQNIYKAKARKDAAEIFALVQGLPDGIDVDPAAVDLFCKNAAFVKLINGADATAGGLTDVVGESLRTPFRLVIPREGCS